MPCTPFTIDVPHRLHGYMCSSDEIVPCWVCGGTAEYLCDFQVDGGTCDVAMCAAHAATVGVDAHYCGAHFGGGEESGE